MPAAPTLIRFGAYRGGGRRLRDLDIDGTMKRDWRATTYAPDQVTAEMVADARSTCVFDYAPAPLDDAAAEIRTVVGAARNGSCAFAFGRPAPCHLLIRKIPAASVPTYLARVPF